MSVSVSEGEFVGLAGPSGSGKSTLLHILAALDTPTTGSVRVRDIEVSHLSGGRCTQLRLDRVGIVFQHSHFLPSLSALANVAVPLGELGYSKTRRHERASDLLGHVGPGDRVQHRPGEVSGGERRRVAVARALTTDPQLVITTSRRADEPTSRPANSTWTPTRKCWICRRG